MRHTILSSLTTLTMLVFATPLWALVNCMPDDITLASQDDVINFQVNHGPDCDYIVKSLTIEGPSITDLSPLSALNYAAFGSKVAINNTSVTNLAGLENLAGVYWFELNNNTSLISISDLLSLSTVAGPLFINGNTSLSNLNGLDNVTALNGGALFIENNSSLTDLNGVSNITSINASLVINNNDALTDLDDFIGLSHVSSNISISYNDALLSISGLSGLVDFNAVLDVRYNTQISSLGNLSNLTDLNGLVIYANNALLNLDGLSGLETMGNGTALAILYNNVLNDIDGLSGIVSAEWNVEVSNNPQLGNCSALQTLLDSVDDALPGPGPGVAGIPDVGEDVTIENNKAGCNSIAEIIAAAPPPDFELLPQFAGLYTHVGARSVVKPDNSCEWSPDENVEIWWSKPEAKLATFIVDNAGCFEGLFFIELDPGDSPLGERTVQARGSVSGIAEQIFEQVEPELRTSPHQGASDREVVASGCNWIDSNTVNILWQQDGTVLGELPVDGSGCINAPIKLPKVKGGIFALTAESDNGLISATAYQVFNPTITLTPAEGPPDNKILLDGRNWFAEEVIEFAFTDDNVTFDTAGTGTDGRITTNSPVEPTLYIPASATLGEKTIRATGQTSGLTVNVPFTVRQRTLEFTPNNGLIGEAVTVSGCGWAGNEEVRVVWGHPDHNNQEVSWSANVDTTTGCFGNNQELVINVPPDTITGPIENTATGNVGGIALGTFTVNYPGWVEPTSPNGYAGYAISLHFHDVIVNEILTIQAGGSPSTQISVQAMQSDFLFDYTLPTGYNAGVNVNLSVTGTKGFVGSVQVNIQDNAEISVPDPTDVRFGRPLKVTGRNWSSFETVNFKLIQGAQEFPLYQSTQVASGEINFLTYLTLPDTLVQGDYILRAEGNRNRDAELNVFVGYGGPAAFTLGAVYADPPPDLDGYLASGEWDYQQRANIGSGFISTRSDDSRLYILLDLLGDTVKDSLGADNFWLSFDTTGNGVIDAGLDLNFRLQGSDLILEQYNGPNSFSPRNSVNLRSAYASGFGCFTPDNSARIEFSGLNVTLVCDQHRVFEIGIDLQTINAQPGDFVRIGVRAQSQVPTFSDELPSGFPSDFSELGVILLADSQLSASPPSGVVTGIGSNDFEIEITQAIQDADNSLKLVADKATVVRVYPAVADEALVRTFLFGSMNGQDLPGSPLVALTTVPSAILREDISHTANFLLPSSWTSEGVRDLLTITENLGGFNPKALQQQAQFIVRDTPEIWSVPFNVGETHSPIVPRSGDMAEQEQVLAELTPTPDVTFVRKQWTNVNHTLSTATCPAISSVGNNDSLLDPGETITCFNAHTITDKDLERESYFMGVIAALDGGQLVTGMAGANVKIVEPPASMSMNDTNSTTETQARNAKPGAEAPAGGGGTPRFTLTVSTDVSNFETVGDVINYSYMVSNTGTVAINGPIVVADSKSAMTFGDMKSALNTLWNTESQARAMSSNPKPMPDALHGFKVFSDQSTIGTSDPTWQSGGRGHVVVGQADGRVVNTTTMVHELNHNLDRSSSGTWGKHVSDPEDDDNSDWGCGAGGADPNWPYVGNSEIQEVGFKPALPWLDGTGDLTVLPASHDDYQSYCRVENRPIQWISPYRWQRVFTRFTPVAPSLKSANGEGTSNVYYLSGTLNASGTGSFDPVVELPGTIETAMLPGEFSIEILDALDNVLDAMSFAVSFIDVEGDLLESVNFFYQLPSYANATKLLLKHNGTILHSIEASANAPSLQVTYPSGGEIWADQQTIQWQASDADGDPLTFTVFYSPNNGTTWYPVASQLTGNEYLVEASTLPPGTQGLIQVVATDGFLTSWAESSGEFTVLPADPIVVIHAPADNLVATPGDWIELSGSASLPSGPAEDLTYVWFVDGEPAEVRRKAHLKLEKGTHSILLIAYDGEGNSGQASVTVTVEKNNPPNTPILPVPASGSSSVFVNSNLNWVGGDIDGDPVRYDVFLEAGNSEPGILVCDKVTVSDCMPVGGLLPFTQYFWQVIAYDDQGEKAEGEVWMFETGNQDSNEVIFSSGFEQGG